MSEPDRPLYNTLQQTLSSDLNKQGQLGGKAAMDRLIGLLAGPDLATITPPDVTLEGLDVTPGTGMQVSVSAGEAIRFTTSGFGFTTNGSRYRLIRLATDQTQAIDAAAGSDRIDLISVADTSINADPDTRNILVLPGRAVTPTVVDTSVRPSATLQYTAGTPGATPGFPSTPAGHIPIAYVYVPTGATSINGAHIMDARVYPSAVGWRRMGPAVLGGVQPRGGSASLAQIRVSQGTVVTPFGGIAQLSTELGPFTFSDLSDQGAGTPALSSMVDLYVVARGSGAPVGKSEPSGAALAMNPLHATNPPTVSGMPPGGGLIYRPLLAQGITNVEFTTTRASYVGSMQMSATVANQLEGSGGGLLISRDGGIRAAAIDESGGFRAVSGFTRIPTLRWTSGNTCDCADVSAIINRTPVIGGQVTFDITTDLPSGEVEANDTWYYCYLRASLPTTSAATNPNRGPVFTVVPVISSEAPNSRGYKPTPETGFSTFEYLYCGSVYNDSAGTFKRFEKRGSYVQWRFAASDPDLLRRSGITPATSPAVTNVTLLLPETTDRAEVNLQVNWTSSPTTTAIFCRDGESTGTNYSWKFDLGAGGLGTPPAEGGFNDTFVIGNRANGFDVTADAAEAPGEFRFRVIQSGYLEDIYAIG